MLTARQVQLLSQIKIEAIRLDWDVAFGGKSTGNNHLSRVNKIAKYLFDNEGGDEFCVLAGAWSHDVSLAFGSDYDPKFVEVHTKEFLVKFNDLSKNEIATILQCATGHENGQGELPLEAKIVHDADVVDKSGMLGVIRHIWKMTNMLEERILSGQADLEVLVAHLESRKLNLFTETAKKLVSKIDVSKDAFVQDNNFSLEMLTIISKLSMEGKTSDAISEWLISKYDHKSLIGLCNQLSCDYLNN